MIVIRSARTRRILRYLIPFFIIPALIAAGVFLLREKRYALIALLMVLCALILFATGFERKRTGRRRMVLVSVLTALSVAGRFIPLLKPVAAMTILSGVYLGSEAGFLVGALSAVISNFYFGQGPWTPFQMFAWGLIGLIAGYLSRPMQKSRGLLLLYGLIAGIAYSFIMDIWTVLWYNGTFNAGLYGAALLSAIPHTIAYMVSNLLFLALFAKPFGEKLGRIRLKYDI